jgi:hypothetical protein
MPGVCLPRLVVVRDVQREAYGEFRAAVRVIARVDLTAMQARVLPGDRQAQAASIRTRPRRVGFVEPVEDMRDRGRGQPVAVVAYFHCQLPVAVAA